MEPNDFKIGAISEMFMKIRDDITRELSLVELECGKDIVAEICEIVRSGEARRIFDLVSLLNFFCHGSPKRYRLLRFRLDEQYPDVFETLISSGFSVHGHMCIERKVFGNIMRLIKNVQKQIRSVNKTIGQGLEEIEEK
jgi:hypothetical protein